MTRLLSAAALAAVFALPLPAADAVKPSGNWKFRFEEGQVIGLIEVMKTYTELKSTAAGTIAEFLVEDESEVSAGQEIATLR